MRVDETGEPCPETLGEYRDYCAAFGGEECEAVEILDLKIRMAAKGRGEKVAIPDIDMRRMFMPLLAVRGGSRDPSSPHYRGPSCQNSSI